MAKFILSNVGSEFCQLVMQERAALSSYETNSEEDRKITWKRAVNGLRELCDVCATTLFNCHYVCERCGFVVCIDCHKARKANKILANQADSLNIKKEPDNNSDKLNREGSHDNTDDTTCENGASENVEQPPSNTTKKSKRDSCGWIYCTKNEEHSHEKLILTQIIAGDSLEKVWNLMHEARKKLNLGECVNCNPAPDQESELDDKIKSEFTDGDKQLLEAKSIESDLPTQACEEEASHSTLKGLLLASHNGITTSEDKDAPPQQVPSNTVIKQEFPNNFDEQKSKSISATPLNGGELFNESSSDEDSQEEAKLSQQVTAAIEGCISSLPNGFTNSPSPLREDTSELTKELVDPVREKSVERNDASASGVDTHSWLCEGNLLILEYAKHKMNIQLFRKHWVKGRPVLVRGVDKLMKLDMWLPQFFGKEFGDYRSDLVDCRNGDIHRHSMKKYWDGFEPANGNAKKRVKEENLTLQIPSSNNEECSIGPSYYSGSALWRLKDWPPGQDFYEILPSHYEDFMNNLPLHEYTSRFGKLNLACRLPKEMLKPDLGPKMYSAYGTSKFPERGTTNLHLDISDAINVMVYVSGATAFKNKPEELIETFQKIVDESHVDNDMKQQIMDKKYVPGALWHIFKPSDVSKMRDFLNKVSDERKISLEKRTDPIHDQTWYLDQDLLDRLDREYGVKSFPILQCMGDAILIPAGSPHQVKNLRNCIKVANDFVSPENVQYCLKLTDEFRSLPETHINQEDKLQIKNILYHSVKESLQYIRLFETGKLESEEKSDDEEI